jgi:hypothetical protein
MKNNAGWDDWLMVLAIAFIICSTVTANLGTTYGWGHHIWDVKPEWSKPTLMTSWFNQLLLVIIMALVKLSLLISYLRFFTQPLFRRLTWAMVALIVSWALAYMIALFLVCKPLKDYWETIQFNPPNCIDQSASTFSFSITNLATDLMVLILPMRTLWMLKLPIRERLVLITVKDIGILACVASAVRVYYSYRTLNITYDITCSFSSRIIRNESQLITSRGRLRHLALDLGRSQPRSDVCFHPHPSSSTKEIRPPI